MANLSEDTRTTSEFKWSGVSIVLMSCSVNLLWGFISKGFGVLLPTLKDQFTTHTWIIGIIVSMSAVTADLVGFLTMPLENKFGSRPLLIFCTSMVGVGMLLVPISTSLIHIALTSVLLMGTGLGIIDVLYKTLLGRHFDKHYTLACGIAYSGQAVALIAIAPLMQFFLDTYGWRGATLLIAGICCHPIASAALVRDNKPHYQPVTDQSEYSGSQTEDKITAKASCVRLSRAVDLGILLEFNFWIANMCHFGITIVYNSWMVYFVPHLQAKGFSPEVAASLCSAGAVGYFIGSIMWAPVIDRGFLRCSTGIVINSVALTMSFIVDPWVNDIPGIVVTAFIFGLATSALYTLSDILTKELLGVDRLAGAFGWIGALSFVPRLLSGFLPGWLYDTSGSYDLAFILIGLTPTLSILPMVIGLLRKRI